MLVLLFSLLAAIIVQYSVISDSISAAALSKPTVTNIQ